MYANEDFLLELLEENGTVTAADLEGARHRKKNTQSVIEVLLETGKMTEEDLSQTLAVNSGMDYIDLTRAEIDTTLAEAVDVDAARRYKIIPVSYNGSQMTVAVADPLDFDTLDAVRHVIPHELEFVCAPMKQIKQLLIELYGTDGLSDEQATELGAEGGVKVTDGAEGGEEGGDAPVIRLVAQMLQEAYQNKASDIHIEPMENEVRVRYRIDGALHKTAEHPLRLLSAIVSRIKIMTGTMSIAEKRVPQDGRIRATIGDKDLDLRVSTVPTSNGESIVMRILDKQSLLLGLPQLGFFSDDEENFNQLIRLPDGIILVTGPTGSGKTTTLYACLNEINKPDRKIITVEDPVEYVLSGINQVQVKEDIGMTFGAALRSILRQAPNIIMIGEIRDIETASIAINASLTGHLVFSTLHTNDAPGAVARMADIGVKRFLIASAVRAIVAQRLVRTICPDCAVAGELTEKDMTALNMDVSQMADAQIKEGEGCRTCRMTGYRGRLGIYEVFNINDEVTHMINEELSTPQLRKKAREIGMRTLREDGVRKVLSGITTASEVVRVTMSDSD